MPHSSPKIWNPWSWKGTLYFILINSGTPSDLPIDKLCTPTTDVQQKSHSKKMTKILLGTFYHISLIQILQVNYLQITNTFNKTLVFNCNLQSHQIYSSTCITLKTHYPYSVRILPHLLMSPLIHLMHLNQSWNYSTISITKWLLW